MKGVAPFPEEQGPFHRRCQAACFSGVREEPIPLPKRAAVRQEPGPVLWLNQGLLSPRWKVRRQRRWPARARW